MSQIRKRQEEGQHSPWKTGRWFGDKMPNFLPKEGLQHKAIFATVQNTLPTT